MKIWLFKPQRLHILITLSLIAAHVPMLLCAPGTADDEVQEMPALPVLLPPDAQEDVETPQAPPAAPKTTPAPDQLPRRKISLPGNNPNERIEFQFEDADLQNLLTQMSELFDVSFITDDTINPLTKNGKSIKGNKISFKTNKPMTRSQAWDLFLSFLDIAELSIIPEADPQILRITSIANAKTSPIPTYIGVRPESLPDESSVYTLPLLCRKWFT